MECLSILSVWISWKAQRSAFVARLSRTIHAQSGKTDKAANTSTGRRQFENTKNAEAQIHHVPTLFKLSASLGVTCLFTAAKLEEIYPPKCQEFAYVTDGACNVDQIRTQEIEICTAGFRMTVTWIEKMQVLECRKFRISQDSRWTYCMTLGWKLQPITAQAWLTLFLQTEQFKQHNITSENSSKVPYGMSLSSSLATGNISTGSATSFDVLNQSSGSVNSTASGAAAGSLPDPVLTNFQCRSLITKERAWACETHTRALRASWQGGNSAIVRKY